MLTFLVLDGFNVFNYYTCSFPEPNTLSQIGNFSSRIGKKNIYFLALGIGPNFSPKFPILRALNNHINQIFVINLYDFAKIAMSRVRGYFGPIPVWTPGPFGPIPFRSGRFSLGHFCPISGVSRFGPILAGHFGPLYFK